MGRSHRIVGFKADALQYTRHLTELDAHDTIRDAFAGTKRRELRQWREPDGRTLREVEQCSPWASGPVSFLCLQNDDGEYSFVWTDSEIEERV